MTAQINDTCFHRKIDFAVAGISGSGLFSPDSLNITPVSTSTACWRGYVAHYSIINDELFLTGLHIGLPPEAAVRAKAGEGPELFGVSPTFDRFMGFFYQGFQFPVPFTGGLLLAEGFIRGLYVHMGFHPAWKYGRVREVVLNAGHLTDDNDRSTQMAEIRNKMAEDAKRSEGEPVRPTREQIAAWVEKCFSRDY